MREAYFIKLGERGEWEQECLREGTLRLDYKATPPDLCSNGDWEAVRQFWEEQRGNRGVATRDKNQIRIFYEAAEDSVFVTFTNGLMYWCRPTGLVEVLADGGRKRKTLAGWKSYSNGGTQLTVDRLSGHLLKVQMFQGAICRVKDVSYLRRKLNHELLPEIVEAENAEQALMNANISLMRRLTWQDFELLVDLTFSASGWRRMGVVGRTQRTVDIDLLLPSTGERAFVQIKAQASETDVQEYTRRFVEADAHSRMFFVWHTGNISREYETDGIYLIGPERLARMVLDAGLTSWLREKVH